MMVKAVQNVAQDYQVMGVVFQKGEPKEITDPALITYLKGHPDFSVEETGATPPPPPPKEPPKTPEVSAENTPGTKEPDNGEEKTEDPKEADKTQKGSKPQSK